MMAIHHDQHKELIANNEINKEIDSSSAEMKTISLSELH